MVLNSLYSVNTTPTKNTTTQLITIVNLVAFMFTLSFTYCLLAISIEEKHGILRNAVNQYIFRHTIIIDSKVEHLRHTLLNKSLHINYYF